LSDPTGPDFSSLAIGAGVTGAVGLAIAFVRGLFTRNVDNHDKQLAAEKAATEKKLDELRDDVKNVLLELRSMHDEQTRQRSEITVLGKELATVQATAKAAHERIDALVSPPPGRGRTK
jgi:peptidoglycan hydrolase CwlO-like protein